MGHLRPDSDEGADMNKPRFMNRVVVGAAVAALTAGGLGLSGVGPIGVAQADDPVGGPFRWCPGDDMQYSTTAYLTGADNGPGGGYSWDMSICHTWYRLKHEKGNVLFDGALPSNVWDGDNPPAGEVMDPLPPCVPAPLPCL